MNGWITRRTQKGEKVIPSCTIGSKQKKKLVLAACLTKVNFYSFAMKCAVKLVEACLPERAAKQNGLM